MSDDAMVSSELDNTQVHDPKVPKPLLDFMGESWAPQPSTVDGPHRVAEHTARRRAALSARFPGEWLVVPTGPLKVRSNDTDFRFRPGSDFYYLTGGLESDCVLVMEPTQEGHRAVVYLQPRSDRSTAAFFTDRRYGELWVGPRLGLSETRLLLGVDTAPLSELPAALALIGSAPVRVVRGIDPSVEEMVRTQEATDAELATVLSEHRLVKDAYEVDRLRDAIAASIHGFEDVVRELPQAKATSERYIEGTFYRRARVEGNDVGYYSICAAGHHATTLHWIENHGPVRDGDLLLLDAGVESVELYTADITRTLPINGRFSPEQREVYELVLAAQEAAIAVTRAGAEFMAPHRAAMEVLARGLHDMGILPVTPEESLDKDSGLHRRWTLHGTSHMLGIDVHDCAAAREEVYSGTLEEGYVFTIEPGLYFQVDDELVPERYRGIGVRIEDDILVTADGCVNLSEALPRTADDVEAWMARLQA